MQTTIFLRCVHFAYKTFKHFYSLDDQNKKANFMQDLIACPPLLFFGSLVPFQSRAQTFEGGDKIKGVKPQEK